MKRLWHITSRYRPWLTLLLGVDAFCALLLWLSDVKMFQMLIWLLVISSLLMAVGIMLVMSRRETAQRERFLDFLSDPTESNEEQLLSLVNGDEKDQLRLLGNYLRDQKAERSRMADALQDYEEYVESWAHEAKTPLSLLTMLLDNHSDDLPPTLQARLDYVRTCLQEDVTQMLYYARLKSSTKDHRLEQFKLKDCIDEVLEDYSPLFREKQFVIIDHLQDETVYTDRRGLQFMLGQIVNNAIKYSDAEPELTIRMTRSSAEDVLFIEDNGIGVKSYDLPYIFQKGFTGDSTASRKKATGMGLYLTKKMADELSLRLEASSLWGKGFTIAIHFVK